jgi:hypothetical protein
MATEIRIIENGQVVVLEGQALQDYLEQAAKDQAEQERIEQERAERLETRKAPLRRLGLTDEEINTVLGL